MAFSSVNSSSSPAGLFAGQSHALQLLATGHELETVFAALAQTVESDLEAEAHAAIMVVDPDGKRLRHGAAPSLPPHYGRAIDGIEIADVGTCSAAAYLNEVIVTEDIETDHRWSQLKSVPLALGLRAAWSVPIRASNGQVLGTFGTYFREPRGPTPVERELVEVLAQTAAMAIEQRATQTALSERETFLQGVIGASADCIKVLDIGGRLQWMSQNGLCAMEVEDFEAIRNSSWLSFWQDEATVNRAGAAIAAALAGDRGSFQGFCPTLRGTPKWWDVVVTAMRDKHGEIGSLLSVSRDITEQKRAEEALRASEQRYRVLAEELEQRVAVRTAELAESNQRLRLEMSEREKAERERQQLLVQLVSAEEEERRRIARELHDHVGQQITGSMLALKALRQHTAPGAHEQLRQLEAITTALGREIHDLAIELRPPALDDLGLEQALTHLLENWSTQTGVEVQFSRRIQQADRFPAAIETTLYRLVQEALTNVAKHARASRVGVIIERGTDDVRAIVEDDGEGFDPERAGLANGRVRLGLQGMHERAKLCGGTVIIESGCGIGTTVFARLPLHVGE